MKGWKKEGRAPSTENGIAGLSSFVCLRVMLVQRCASAARSGTYAAVFLTFFAASFCADRSLRRCTAVRGEHMDADAGGGATLRREGG